MGLQVDGAIIRISDKDEGRNWDTSQIASLDNNSLYVGRDAFLDVIDLDNNGSDDLLLSFGKNPAGKNAPGAFVWLSDEENKFSLLHNRNPPPGIKDADWVEPDFVFQPADLNEDGRLDLIGLSNDGQPIQALNHGTKNYHWQAIRPRAAQTTGDQRINSFGIGGEMEIRAGLTRAKTISHRTDCSFWSGRSERRRCSAHRMA